MTQKNIQVKLEEEDTVIMLLNALPESFVHLKDVMLFFAGRALLHLKKCNLY